MTQSKPDISIIVAIYNVKNYLHQCLKSILDQTYSNIEIILVNDGSTDGSELVCDDYANRYPKIKVIHQVNGGLYSARNTGLKLATGCYLYFMDGDDWIEPDLIASAYSVAVGTNADCVLFGHLKEIAMENGGVNVINTVPPKVSFSNHSEVTANMWKLFQSGCGFAVWEQLIRTASIVKNGITFPPYRRGTDMGFLLHLYKYINSFHSIPKAYYHYNAFNTANKYNPQLIETHIRLFHSYLDAFQNDREFTPYTTQLFILWFAHVIPTNLVNNKTFTYRQKIEWFRKYFSEPQVKRWIQEYSVSQCRGIVTKMLMTLLKARNANIIYFATKFNIAVKNNIAFNYKKLFYPG